MLGFDGIGRRNRRLRRQHVLDVRLRTREVRAARLRLVAAALSLALGALVVGVVLWRGGEWALQRLVFDNPSFEVRRLQIDTGGRLPPELVQTWLGVRRGDNLLALDLDRIRRDLLLLPVVGSVSLQRVPPDTLRVRVKARVPVAEVVLGRRDNSGGLVFVSHYLDELGYVVRFSPTEHEALTRALIRRSLPRITGLSGSLLHAGRRVSLPSVQAALGVLQAFDASPMFGRAEVLAVDVSRTDAVELLTGDGGRVIFGLGAPEPQFARWRAVHDYAQRQGKQLVSLDLSVPRNVPAVLAAVPPATPPPKPSQPSTHRKPHV